MLLRLLDSVLPPLCLGCNEIVAEPGALCAACWPGFTFIAAPHCARCGVPFAEEVGPDAQCGACLKRPPRFRKARAALVYDDKSRRLVLPFNKSVDMGDFTYYLLTPSHREESDSMKTFRLWLLEQFATQ